MTCWSKLDTVWRGVSVDMLLDQVEHHAPYVLAFCDGGYITNLPIEDVTGGRAWVAFDYGGQPLGPNTAGPPGCSCHTCTSGRARNGCGAWSCSNTANLGDLQPSHVRGPMAGTAVHRRLTRQVAIVTAVRSYAMPSADGESATITV